MLVPRAIYAGDTPLVCTLRVAQTGPMELTVQAGSFTTTGEARILDATEIAQMRLDPAALIAAGKAEWLPDGVRLRVWLQDAQGQPILRSATYTLAVDVAFTLTADPTSVKTYVVELGLLAEVTEVLCRSQLAGEAQPAVPAGWIPLHWLAGPVIIPPGTLALDALDIPALTVLPGFPVGTVAADWHMQSGVA